MIWVRSWLYLICFVSWTFVVASLCLPTLLSPPSARWTIRIWTRGITWLARTLVGITCRVEGREHVPPGPCIIAAQHQSSFETYRMFLEFEKPVYVLKRELIRIPLVGWYMQAAGMVDIDRSGGGSALRKVLRATDALLADGRQIIIFPEGTRVLPGTEQPYQPGVAALYSHCDVPLIPMALNSGRLWGKTRILKRPGEIVFRFLPALPRGLSKEVMLTELRARLEAAAKELPAD